MVDWCNAKKMQAARDGNLVDFENYSQMQKYWEKWLERKVDT